MKSFSEYLGKNAKQANKFNIHWQIVRTNARDIKDVDDKISYVIEFLNKNKNIHNYGRVHNWLKMTGVAYKGGNREKFVEILSEVEYNKEEYASKEDMSNDLNSIPKEDLEKVYKDLSKRKYGFQYKSIPKAHTEFLNKLEEVLDK
tara:strand:- start:157 stop:594 length:438 start_codon:yes stop_codon:yes gene_type:complete